MVLVREGLCQEHAVAERLAQGMFTRTVAHLHVLVMYVHQHALRHVELSVTVIVIVQAIIVILLLVLVKVFPALEPIQLLS